MHIIELRQRFEYQAREAVRRHFPLDWKEDAITHDLLIRLRNEFRQVTVYGVRHPISVDWEIYKLHGQREQSYGDIGLLVRYALPGGNVVEGAGFLEAKVRGRDTTKFLQVRHEQVSRLLSRSPETRLLLYDYNPVTVIEPDYSADIDWDFPHPHWHSGFGRSHVSSAPVLPLQLAAAVNHYDDTLYRFAHSFSHQFCHRYFNLHDLDFGNAAISAVKGFPTNVGSPSVVMVIRVAPEGQEPPEVFRPSESIYGVLE
jgi:hypothetical protein